jgi:hypothetical protein
MTIEMQSEWMRRVERSDAGRAFSFFDDEASFAIEKAAAACGNDSASSRAAIAALEAVEAAVPQLLTAAGAPPRALEAFDDICLSLEYLRNSLRMAQSVGRPTNCEMQARFVVAFHWLQDLRTGALSREEAFAELAARVPESMIDHAECARGAGRMPTRTEQLTVWLEAFSRRDTRRQHALASARNELFEEWAYSWREVRPLRGGSAVYSEQISEHDCRDASPANVFAWLARGLQGTHT